MGIRITDLTPIEAGALYLLDGEQRHLDRMGISSGMLSPELNCACVLLVQMGLAEQTIGTQGHAWFHLTEDGKRLSKHGVHDVTELGIAASRSALLGRE